MVAPPPNPAALPDPIVSLIRRMVTGLGSQLANTVSAPGDAYAGKFSVAPSVPGQWSDEDEAKQQMADAEYGKRASDLAGIAMTGGMPFAQPGAAGIFGGKLAAQNLVAKGIDQPALAMKMADHMDANGATAGDIYNVTSKMLEGTPYAGVSKGAEGKWRFEIPDNQARTSLGWPSSFGEKLSHPLLNDAYPDIADARMKYLALPKEGWHSPAEEGFPEEIGVSGIDGPNTQLSTLLHEGSHGVQVREDFAQGANPEMYRDVSQQAGASSRQIRKAMMQAYRNTAGEVEARNVATRQRLTPAERRFIPPWITEDVPRDQQIVRFGNLAP